MIATKMAKRNKGITLKIVKFTIPLIFTNLLSQIFIIVDNMIAKEFAGEGVVGAIGATVYLNSLFTNLIIGISVGVSAVIAQTIGEKDEKTIKKAIHTSFAMGVYGGLLIGVLGVVLSRPLLILLETPANFLDMSTTYMIINFAGYIFTSIYTFAGAILRAMGDTKRPLIYLTISGVIKVILTFLFVAIFHGGVEAIAWATVISAVVATILTTITLLKEKGVYKLYIKKIRIHLKELIRILKMGIPIGLQTSMVAIANVVLQSSINSFDTLGYGIVGASAAGNINSILYCVLTSMSHASTVFCSQNYGAKNYNMLVKSLLVCVALCFIVGLIVGAIFHIFAPNVISLFAESEQAVSYGVEIAHVICLTYFLSGLMETFSGSLRAINKPNYAFATSIIGLCVFRVIWIYTYYASHRSLSVLYYCYPLSWIITTLLNLVLFIYFFKKIDKKDQVVEEDE